MKLRNLILSIVVGLVLVAGLAGPAIPASAANLSVTLEVFPNPMPGLMEGANIVATVKSSGTPVADADVTISIPNPGNYVNDAMYLRVPGGEWWNRASSVSGKTDADGQFSVFGDIGFCPFNQMQVGLSSTASKAGYGSGSATCTWVIEPGIALPQAGEPAGFDYITRYWAGSDDVENKNKTWCALKCPNIPGQTIGNPVNVKSGDTVWFEIQIGRHADLEHPFSLPAFKNATEYGQSATGCVLMSLPNGDVVGEFLPDQATIDCWHVTGFMELGWVPLGSVVSLAELIGAMQMLPDMVGMVGPDWWDFCMFLADRAFDVMDAVADISYGDAHGPNPQGVCFDANNPDVNIESVLYGVENFAVGGFRMLLPVKFTGSGQGKLNFHSTYAYTTDSQWVLNTAKVQFPEILVNVAGPPEANAGPDLTVEQASAAGTQVMLDGSASTGGNIVYEWREGTTLLGVGDRTSVTFPLGTHHVTLKVTSAGGYGESDTDEVVITVRDTTPPNVDINVPGGGFSLTYEADSPAGLKVDHYDVGVVVTDICDTNPTVVFQPPEGTTFPLGATGLVQVFATDDSGNVGEGLFGITVVDTTPPVITTSDQWPEYEANVPGGAIVDSFEGAVVSVTDICDPNPTVTFVPPPGYTFIAGATCLIEVFATDSWGNVGKAYWGITVMDTTPPDITAPPDVTVEQTSAEGTPVDLGEPAVSDICDADPDVTNDAPEVFPLGTTTVTWTAEDYLWNVATDTQMVTVVDTTLPNITAPADITQSTDPGKCYATVELGEPAVSDICDADPDVTNDAPEVFLLGETVVTWTAEDDSGNAATDTQIVTVVDTTPPIITAPDDIEDEQTSATGTPVDLGEPAVSDICDADPDVTNDAPAVFPLGDTVVTWTAEDDSGNVATDTQIVTVVDTTPPDITAPDDIEDEQASADGTPVDLGTPTVSDICDADPDVTNDAPAVFPLGDTVVTWTAEDDSGNVATDTQTVTVVDTTPPIITAPADVTDVEQTNADGTPVDLGTPTVSDICDADPDVTNDAPDVFPLGETVVTWTAEDDSGNVATATQTVTIVDTTAPEMKLTVLEETLWPVNHKMVLAAIVTGVSDVCDADLDVSIEVMSNEPINGIGDGNTDPDWVVEETDEGFEIWLRAERAGPGSGREYNISVTVTDDSGNSTTVNATVTVSHDQRKKPSK